MWPIVMYCSARISMLRKHCVEVLDCFSLVWEPFLNCLTLTEHQPRNSCDFALI